MKKFVFSQLERMWSTLFMEGVRKELLSFRSGTEGRVNWGEERSKLTMGMKLSSVADSSKKY